MSPSKQELEAPVLLVRNIERDPIAFSLPKGLATGESPGYAVCQVSKEHSSASVPAGKNGHGRKDGL